MSAPQTPTTAPRWTPEPISRYIQALADYNLRVGTWLGLDPEQVFKLDVYEASPTKHMQVIWKTHTPHKPLIGTPQPPNVFWDGEHTEYTLGTVLDYDEERALIKHCGPKPTPPAPFAGDHRAERYFLNKWIIGPRWETLRGGIEPRGEYKRIELWGTNADGTQVGASFELDDHTDFDKAMRKLVRMLTELDIQ